MEEKPNNNEQTEKEPIAPTPEQPPAPPTPEPPRPEPAPIPPKPEEPSPPQTPRPMPPKPEPPTSPEPVKPTPKPTKEEKPSGSCPSSGYGRCVQLTIGILLAIVALLLFTEAIMRYRGTSLVNLFGAKEAAMIEEVEEFEEVEE
jgi:hypothetical protein